MKCSIPRVQLIEPERNPFPGQAVYYEICSSRLLVLEIANRLYYPGRFIDRVYRHLDSIGTRLWRSFSRRSAAGVLPSTKHSCPTRRACVDYGCRHRCRAGLEPDPHAQRRLACVLHAFWYTSGPSFAEEQASTNRESVTGADYLDLLRLFVDRPQTPGTTAGQPKLAFRLRILCGSAGRRIRDERSAACYLWGHAAMVSATLPGNLARIFSACQHHRNGRLLAGWTLDFRRNPLLPAVAASHASGRVPWQSD